jgi:dihydrofolate reductase
MRKLISFLFISVDGVVEAPDRFVRDDAYSDLTPLIEEGIADQDSVLLGRSTYEKWSQFWPDAKIEPFATFINNTPKFVVSKTLKALSWHQSTLLSGRLEDDIADLKNRPGKAIGVHGRIGLVQSLLTANLLDEMRVALCPAVAGQGRHLLSRDGDPIQLHLQSARTYAGRISVH